MGLADDTALSQNAADVGFSVEVLATILCVIVMVEITRKAQSSQALETESGRARTDVADVYFNLEEIT